MEGFPRSEENLVHDPLKAEEMARASNETRSQIEAEKAKNDGKEYSIFNNLANQAEREEEMAKLLYETKEYAQTLDKKGLAAERAKAYEIYKIFKDAEENYPN